MSREATPAIQLHRPRPLEAPAAALILCLPVVITGALTAISLIWLASADPRTVTENWNNGQLVYHHETYVYAGLIVPAIASAATFAAFVAFALRLVHLLGHASGSGN